MSFLTETFRQRLVVRLPGVPAPAPNERSLRPLREAARRTASTLLVLMMAVGVAVAVLSALAVENTDREGLGTLGTEFGAALWLGAAVAWGGRRGATLGRGVLLSITFFAGVVLIGLALAFRWTGAGLALAMEFGVGMLAVPVIDVVLIGSVHRHLEALGDGAELPAVEIALGRDGRLVSVRKLDD